MGLAQSVLTIDGGHHLVIRTEQFDEQLAYGLIVLHDEHHVGRLAGVLAVALLALGCVVEGYHLHIIGFLRLLRRPLLRLEGVDGKRQKHGEHSAGLRCALHVDDAVVGLDDALGEGESKPRTRLEDVEVLGLVEVVENLTYLLHRNRFAGVDHAQHGLALGVGGAHGDGAALGRMLQRIRQQVVDDLLHHLHVEARCEVLRHVADELHADARRIFAVEQTRLLHEVGEVVFSHLDVELALFLLAEVEQFGDQCPQLRAVLVNGQYLVVDGGREVLGVEQRLGQGGDDGERRAYLVGDIGEEVYFRAVHLFYVLDALPVVYQLLAQLHAVLVADEEVAHEDERDDDVDDVSPPRRIPRRQDADVELGHGHAARRRPQLEGVRPRGQADKRQHLLVDRHACPFVLIAAEAIEQFAAVAPDGVGRGNLDAEVRLVVLQLEAAHVGHGLVENAGAVERLHLPAVDEEVGEEEAVGGHGLEQVTLGKGEHAVDAAQTHQSAARDIECLLVGGG